MGANAAVEILIWSGQAGKDSGGKLQRDYSKMTDGIPLLDCNAANAPFNDLPQNHIGFGARATNRLGVGGHLDDKGRAIDCACLPS